MADRCPTCDQPPGDSQRAREHPAVVRWSTFINAKRTDRVWPAPIWSEVIAAVRADQPGLCTDLTCSPRVDWRARALVAESRWHRVAPLIADLNRTALVGASHTELIAAVAEVVAAAEEMP